MSQGNIDVYFHIVFLTRILKVTQFLWSKLSYSLFSKYKDTPLFFKQVDIH